ncbi:hypothetical protein ACFBZI_10145 [Moraxella sp. ZJ142]|uniref:hypothetical protein n=1 Tax=Moraxella marmotae TaxID=3344520 RepID=UPI0035D46E00
MQILWWRRWQITSFGLILNQKNFKTLKKCSVKHLANRSQLPTAIKQWLNFDEMRNLRNFAELSRLILGLIH